MLENKSIVEELWHGNVLPQEEEGRYEEEVKDLRLLIAQNRGRVLKHLSEEGKEHLERYDEAIKEHAAMRESDIFVNAFRLGVRIASECLTEK